MLTSQTDTGARFSHAVPLGASGRVAFIEASGDIVVQKHGAEVGRLAVEALPDARLLVDERDRVLLLTKPIIRYSRGIAGDDPERF